MPPTNDTVSHPVNACDIGKVTLQSGPSTGPKTMYTSRISSILRVSHNCTKQDLTYHGTYFVNMPSDSLEGNHPTQHLVCLLHLSITQKQYAEAIRAVKKNIKTDKGNFIDSLARGAEDAAIHGNMKQLYDTRNLAGKYRQTGLSKTRKATYSPVTEIS